MTQLEQILGPDLTQILKIASHELSVEATKEALLVGITSPQQQAAKLEAQTMVAFEELCANFAVAAQILLLNLALIARKQPDIDYEKAVAELAIARADISQEGERQKLKKISNETLSALTDAAKYVLREKRYGEAMKCFSLLCCIDSNSSVNWIGFGHSTFHTKQYDVAILAYYQAAALDPANPWPFIWAANACENKQDTTSARQLLERAQVLVHESEEKEFAVLEKEIIERLKILK